MELDAMFDKLRNVVLICDKVIIRRLTDEEKTKSGIIMPDTLNASDKVAKGYILKTGPGYPINVNAEFWKEKGEQNDYIKLQADEGDLAHYYIGDGVDVNINNEIFTVISHGSIILLEKNQF